MADLPLSLQVDRENDLSQKAATQIVAGLYRAFMDREPDLDGLEVHARRMRAPPLDVAFLDTLDTFLRSEEARKHRSTTLIETALARTVDLRAPDLRQRDIISLGSHCYTSWMLKQAGLKRRSGPFDWLFSSPAMVGHCLSDDFETFLDPSQYDVVPLSNRSAPTSNICHHSYYRTKLHIDYVFNHRDPSVQREFDYLKRCVGRFREAATSSQEIVLLCTVRDMPQVDEVFAQLQRDVRSYFKSSFLVMVAVSEGSRPLPEVTKVTGNEQGRLFRLAATSKWQDLQFEFFVDDLALFSVFAKSVNERGVSGNE